MKSSGGGYSIYYLLQGWDLVLERDIDGDRAETTDIEPDTRFGAIQVARRVARSIFLGSALSTNNQMVRFNLWIAWLGDAGRTSC